MLVSLILIMIVTHW